MQYYKANSYICVGQMNNAMSCAGVRHLSLCDVTLGISNGPGQLTDGPLTDCTLCSMILFFFSK